MIFLITGVQKDGEREIRVHALLKVAKKKALKPLLAKMFAKAPTGCDHVDSYFGYADGQTITEEESCVEIHEEEASVLTRLGVVHYF